MSSAFLMGFSSQQDQVAALRLELQCSNNKNLPDWSWLTGRLIRNGPSLFDVEQYKLRHWFDGMAMLRKFEFSNGKIWYTNQFLNSQAYQKAIKNGELAYREFATEPHTTFFKVLLSMFIPNYSDNAAVSVTQVGSHYLALNESVLAVEFDPETLDTTGDFRFNDKVKGQLSSSHIHYDVKRGELYNYITKFSMTSDYLLYRIKDGSTTREVFSTIAVKEPAYMHSFGMTPNYIILVEVPLVVANLSNFLFKFRQPILTDFDWKPENGTRFTVVRKSDGVVVKTAYSAPFFAIHHVNAFETEDGSLFVDTLAYDDYKDAIDRFYFDQLLRPDGGTAPRVEFRRYHLRPGINNVDYCLLSQDRMEDPRINYEQYNGYDYQFVYGVGGRADRPNDFTNQLVKVDVRQGSSRYWYEDNCYPGEPVFVGRPGAEAEDDGVVLSVVLDSNKSKSFLLILDAHSLEEQGRAYAPHVIPFGFHGMFYTGPLNLT